MYLFWLENHLPFTSVNIFWKKALISTSMIQRSKKSKLSGIPSSVLHCASGCVCMHTCMWFKSFNICFALYIYVSASACLCVCERERGERANMKLFNILLYIMHLVLFCVFLGGEGEQETGRSIRFSFALCVFMNECHNIHCSAFIPCKWTIVRSSTIQLGNKIHLDF